MAKGMNMVLEERSVLTMGINKPPPLPLLPSPPHFHSLLLVVVSRYVVFLSEHKGTRIYYCF